MNVNGIFTGTAEPGGGHPTPAHVLKFMSTANFPYLQVNKPQLAGWIDIYRAKTSLAFAPRPDAASIQPKRLRASAQPFCSCSKAFRLAVCTSFQAASLACCT